MQVAPIFYTERLNQGLAFSVISQAAVPAAPLGFNLALHINDDAALVKQRRAAVAAKLAQPVQFLHQVHGNAIFLANAGSVETNPVADAALARASDCALGILTADCLPVFLFEPSGRFIAAAHCGWRGLANGLIAKLVAQFCNHYELNSAEVSGYLGPCIGAPRYEVDAPVRDAMLNISAAHAAAFTPVDATHWLCDLSLIAAQQLRSAGVDSVRGGGFCTVSDARLASYRRSPREGRLASIIHTL